MNSDNRPTPEQVLAKIKSESIEIDSDSNEGKLTLFFGYAAGVGKTYAMLQAAQAMKREGRDVVIGYVEPHARPDTQALTEGLEVLPTLTMSYRGSSLREFDLYGALARHPEYILVDELAHTNAVGARHAKRWQDVEELLAAGINVLSTLNVQHVESLNDIVAEISGVQVRETVPDSVLHRAREITLIDVSPDDLLERLRQGKIYVPQQASIALEQFFRRSNLVVLREMALRHTADRVHNDVEIARLGTTTKRPWPTNERLLVCVGPSPTSAKVIRAAKRLADRIHAPWIALHIESLSSNNWSESDRQQLYRNLRLAESLGAEVVQSSGESVSRTLLDYASSRNVTKIVVGKTGEKKGFFWKHRSLVDRLLKDSGNMDVVVVRGVEEPHSSKAVWHEVPKNLSAMRWLEAFALLIAATILTLGMNHLGFSEANLVMVYLLSVVIAASRCGTGPSIVASLASVLVFDFLFTEPYYRVTVYDTQYLITFTVMLVVGLLASTLTSRVRHQADTAKRNERRAESLYRLSRRLSSTTNKATLIEESEKTISEIFDAHAVIYIPNSERKICPILGHSASFASSAKEFSAAQWVLEHNEPAGAGTNTLPSAESLYIPLSTPDNVAGVLAIQPSQLGNQLSTDSRQLLETFAAQVALGIERINLLERSNKAEIEFASEKMRSSLLSAVSHDLRTPLAAIAGAASILEKQNRSNQADSMNHELLVSIVDESQRLNQMVENLLNMTRLSSGKVQINRQWHPVEEVVGSALQRLHHVLVDREVKQTYEQEMLLIHADDILLQTLLINLIDNAVKYSPAKSTIEIHGMATSTGVTVEVADRGSGIHTDEEHSLFEMFVRGSDRFSDSRGTGLGLAICKSIAEAHSGSISLKNREGGGTIVSFTIPHGELLPNIERKAEVS